MGITNHVPKKAVKIPPGWLVDISGFQNIIATPQFQRLNWVSQLGILNEIYPGGSHKRKEHAFGTLHLTKCICDQLEFDKEESKTFRAFGLLHDIGHSPFSHQLEPLLKKDHHEVGLDVLTSIKEAVVQDGVDFEKLKEIFEKKHPLVSDKNLGSDKLDYLLRDGYHMGFDLVTNVFTLISYMGLNHDTIAIEEKGAPQVKKLQDYYAEIHSDGYLCKQGMINQRLLQRAFEEALIDFDVELYTLWGMKDFEVLAFLQESKSPLAKELFEDLINRRSYKTSVVFKIDKFKHSERIIDKPIYVEGVTQSKLEQFTKEYFIPQKLTKLENELAELIGVEKGSLLIPLMPLQRILPKDVRVYSTVSDEPNTLFTLYPEHEKQLTERYLSSFAIRIAAKPELRQKVYDHRKEVVGYILGSVLR
jgi:hypothetical protein